MLSQFIDKYASITGQKQVNIEVFDPCDSKLCCYLSLKDSSAILRYFDAAATKAEKCSTDELRKLMVMLIQVVYGHVKTMPRTVPDLVLMNSVLEKLLSKTVLGELKTIVSNEQWIKLIGALFDAVVTTSTGLMLATELTGLESNLAALSSAIQACSCSPSLSQYEPKFLKQLSNVVMTAYTKTFLLADNTIEIADTVGSGLTKLLNDGDKRDELRCLLYCDVIRKVSSTSTRSDEPTVVSFNGALAAYTLARLYQSDSRLDEKRGDNSLSKLVKYCVLTYMVWFRVEGTSLSTCTGAETVARLLKKPPGGEGRIWAFRMNIAAAMREYLDPTNVGRAVAGSDGKGSYKMVTDAAEVLKAITVTAGTAREVLAVLCSDCRLLSQLMALQGRMEHPVKLLKYVPGLMTQLEAFRGTSLTSAQLKDLEGLCDELRLTVRLSLAWWGLGDDKDVSLFKATFFQAAETSKECNDGLVAAEEFALGCLGLLNPEACSSLAAKYGGTQQFAGLSSQDLEVRAVETLERLSKGKVALGMRLWVLLQARVELLLARTLHLAFGDVRSAYRWAYKGLCLVDKRQGGDMQAARVDGMLIMVDLFDHTGATDFALQYLTEVLLEADCSASQALVRTANFEIIRCWHRMESASLPAALEKLLPAPASQFEDVSKRIAGAAAALGAQLSSSGSRSSPTSAAMPSFRYSSRCWDWQSAGRRKFHTYLSTEEGCGLQSLVSGRGSSHKGEPRAIVSLAIAPSQTSVVDLAGHATLNFEVMRSVRRQQSVALLRDGHVFRSFVAGAASCNVTSECTLDLSGMKFARESVDAWSQHITSSIAGGEEGESSAQTIRSRLYSLLEHSKCGSDSSAAVCFAVLDEASDCLVMGRMGDGEDLVAALPLRGELAALVERWKAASAAEKVQLLNTSVEVNCDKVWTEEERRAWRASRAAANKCVEDTLLELQQALGPWRVLLCGRNSSVSSAFKKLSFEPTKASKPAKKGKVDVKAALPELFRGECRQWIEFVLANTSAKAGATGLSSEEAQTMLTSVALAWNASVSTADAQQLASEVVLECCPAAGESADAAASDSAPKADYAKMTNKDLLKMVYERKLKAASTKAELVRMLQEYDQQQSQQGDVVEEAEEAAAEDSPGGSAVLILDESLQLLPFESLPCLQSTKCTRAPGLALLLASPVLVSSRDGDESVRQVQPKKTWLALDIDNNLSLTRDTMSAALKPFIDRWKWKTFVGEVPEKTEVRTLHEASDLFIFCGHGAGASLGSTAKFQSFSRLPASLLWGCSSGRLKPCGVFDPTGPALHYLLGGAPFVVGNLWDMTSGDLDELSKEFLREVLSSPGRGGDLVGALGRARDKCKYRYANGCAPVVYGVNQVVQR